MYEDEERLTKEHYETAEKTGIMLIKDIMYIVGLLKKQ